MTIPKSIQKQIDEIKDDNKSGANQLALRAVEIIQNQLNLIENSNQDIKGLIYELAGKLINARPSMAPLVNSIGYIITSSKDFTKNSIESTIKAFYESQTAKKSLLDQHFKNFLTNLGLFKPKIMLISYSSTISNLFQKRTDFDFVLYILESRPLLEGQKLAQELAEKYETHLLVDAAAGKFISEIDMVLIGIDSILRDGSIINKIGTYPLTLLAKNNEKLVYAIGDHYKYNLRSHFGLNIEILEKSKEEVFEGVAPNLYIENYYFDITPSKFFDGIISDLGILNINRFLKELVKILPINWFKEFL